MARTQAKYLTPEQKRRFFINLFLRYGATLDVLPYCEKRACLEPGAVEKILEEEAVQNEIRCRMEPVRRAQNRDYLIKAMSGQWNVSDADTEGNGQNADCGPIWTCRDRKTALSD